MGRQPSGWYVGMRAATAQTHIGGRLGCVCVFFFFKDQRLVNFEARAARDPSARLSKLAATIANRPALIFPSGAELAEQKVRPVSSAWSGPIAALSRLLCAPPSSSTSCTQGGGNSLSQLSHVPQCPAAAAAFPSDQFSHAGNLFEALNLSNPPRTEARAA